VLWSETEMAQRLNWERRQFDFRRKINIRDEAEFWQQDLAARWLARAEKKRVKPKPTRPKSVRPPAASFEALDPKDPYHQLAGVDMSRPPW
jgi:hypothetical protein